MEADTQMYLLPFLILRFGANFLMFSETISLSYTNTFIEAENSEKEPLGDIIYKVKFIGFIIKQVFT